MEKKENIILAIIAVIGLIIVGLIVYHDYYLENKDYEANTKITDNRSNNEYKNDDESKVEEKEQVETKPQEENKPVVSDKKETTNNNLNDYSKTDKEMISTFSNIENEVDDLLKSGNSTSVKDKAKGVFITLVDFIFYDGTINGVKFDDLTAAGKQKILAITSSIDQKIESKFPGYKETISENTTNAFNKASDVIKNGANNINNFAKEKLGDEYYQEIIESKDDLVKYTKNAISIVGKVGSNLFSKGKDTLSNWYQNFKNNQ